MSITSLTRFQSTRPRGARPYPGLLRRIRYVSIHAPAWGATYALQNNNAEMGFNPRARVGRDPAMSDVLTIISFQSTRPRGARHPYGERPDYHKVSIHAPAWGATCYYSRIRWESRFNPRARVGRDKPLSVKSLDESFQSTRPRGARLFQEVLRFYLRVSIHAPAWGATGYVFVMPTVLCFNPRARVGRDQINTGIDTRKTFQSTRPRGARRRGRPLHQKDKVSIHAPAWGATTRRFPSMQANGFNPRARVGRDGFFRPMY